MHCKVTGKSCTGVVHFLQQTPFKWSAKLQDTVEHATFDSELMSRRFAVDQMIGARETLKALGVPIESSSWLFGDNQSVITQSTVPSSTLTKRHNALAYHRIRWAVAAGMIKFGKISGKENISDALTKYLPHCDAYPLLKPVLIWRGETLDPGELEYYITNPATDPTCVSANSMLNHTSEWSTMPTTESFMFEPPWPGPGLIHTQGDCQNDVPSLANLAGEDVEGGVSH